MPVTVAVVRTAAPLLTDSDVTVPVTSMKLLMRAPPPGPVLSASARAGIRIAAAAAYPEGGQCGDTDGSGTSRPLSMT